MRFASAPREEAVHDFFGDETVGRELPSKDTEDCVSVIHDPVRPRDASCRPAGEWAVALGERPHAGKSAQNVARANVDLREKALDLVEKVLNFLGLHSHLFERTAKRRFSGSQDGLLEPRNEEKDSPIF